MPTEENRKKVVQIDIKKIFSEKNPKLAKIIPGFVFRYIEHILHQTEINKFLIENKDKYGIDFAREVLKLFKINIKVIGINNIQQNNNYFFVSNHPQGAIDSMCLIDSVYSAFGEVRFMVNDVLLNLHNFEPIFVPINLFGGQSKEAVKKFDEVFNSNCNILFYPAGLVSRKIKGEIKDPVWKKSFINLSVKYKKNIVPVYVNARNSNFFYRLANFRKFIGIKSNIEMFYLPNEMFKQKGKTITVVFGEPISFELFDKKQSAQQWSEIVRKKVYDLKEKIV